jgi:hypothetical protein
MRDQSNASRRQRKRVRRKLGLQRDDGLARRRAVPYHVRIAWCFAREQAVDLAKYRVK